jgi:[ribosomal protein S5]-alanine N-acetyltransferase
MQEKFESDRIYLRKLVIKDVNQFYLSWFKDSDVISYLDVRDLSEREAKDYILLGESTGLYYMYAICEKISNRHIGNLKIGPIDKKHHIADLVTLIGDKEAWGKGYGSDSIKLGNRIAFEKYKLRKLSGGIYSSNIASIKSYLKAGWIIEGILKDHYILDGKFQNRVCVSCFNQNWNIVITESLI